MVPCCGPDHHVAVDYFSANKPMAAAVDELMASGISKTLTSKIKQNKKRRGLKSYDKENIQIVRIDGVGPCGLGCPVGYGACERSGAVCVLPVAEESCCGIRGGTVY